MPARGATVAVVEQRPPAAVRDRWLVDLAAVPDDAEAAVGRVLATDDVMAHVGWGRTDRLVTRHLLDGDERFLERNLGGWAPLWFDALGLGADAADDPPLRAREELVDYWSSIASKTVPAEFVAHRLGRELDGGVAALRRGAAALRAARADVADPDALIARRWTGSPGSAR